MTTTTFIKKRTMAAAFSPHHRKTTTTSTTTRKNTTFFLVVPLLFCASFSSVSVEANAARFGRKLLQDVSLPSEDVLSGEEAMAMAPAPGPTPMTSTMEEEEEEEEEPTILDEPTKRRRSLLQELGNGPVPSDDGILGEVVDGIEDVFAPAPAPTTMEDDDDEDLPPGEKKIAPSDGNARDGGGNDARHDGNDGSAARDGDDGHGRGSISGPGSGSG